ncbi:E3 CR1-gamma1 [simian adenovirus 21]|uniref:E3 CR1-gamma1 n=1 Tax=simian adenovirus 21 TaxID=198503 RepID=UPI0000162133|nr:E3 CR1-gamma1 [Simian adenovirus 21]
MVSTTAFFIISSLAAVTYGRSHLTVTVGSTCTLQGPQEGHVSWWRIYDSGWFIRPCDQPGNKFLCNGRDLTIINITVNDQGFYYGTNYKNNLDYNIIVVPATTPAPRKTTFFSSSASISKTASAILKLQKIALSNSTTSSTNTTSKSVVGIAVAAVMGLMIITLCIIYYACCYRKHEQKSDPLLNFDI